MRVFPTSTIRHPWRSALAVLALQVWAAFALVLVLTLLVELISLFGPIDWYSGMDG